jgi:Ca2+-dependent lipid-binding protein, contains C2 domain
LLKLYSPVLYFIVLFDIHVSYFYVHLIYILYILYSFYILWFLLNLYSSFLYFILLFYIHVSYFYIHLIYISYTSYMHFIYILFTFYLQFSYMLYGFCIFYRLSTHFLDMFQKSFGGQKWSFSKKFWGPLGYVLASSAVSKKGSKNEKNKYFKNINVV